MEVREGAGWRLVVDPGRQPFAVLIGGGDAGTGAWAAEFTQAEARLLAKGAATLVDQHRALIDTLMDEEAIELAMELASDEGQLWLGLEGDRRQWRLHFVLTPVPGRRAVEGGWDHAASAAVAAALSALPLDADQGH